MDTYMGEEMVKCIITGDKTRVGVGVSQIKKKLDSYPTPKKEGLCACISGREICDSENGNGLLQLGWEVCTWEKWSIFCPFKNVGGYSESTCWTITGRVVTTLIIKRDRHVRDCNKSPKSHWSLNWVQWRLLLKFRFLSKSESMTAIFVKSVRTATIAIFQFRIRGCIRCVAVAFRSEE